MSSLSSSADDEESREEIGSDYGRDEETLAAESLTAMSTFSLPPITKASNASGSFVDDSSTSSLKVKLQSQAKTISPVFNPEGQHMLQERSISLESKPFESNDTTCTIKQEIADVGFPSSYLSLSSMYVRKHLING